MKTQFIFNRTKDVGDGTSWYDVLFPEGATVGDFVEWVLTNSRREHGTLYIKNLGVGVFDFDNVVAESEYGVGERGGRFKGFKGGVLDKKIDHVVANGGWGLMDYFIYV